MDSLDDGAKLRVQRWRARLDRWSSIARIKPAAFDAAVKKLPLLYVGDQFEAAAGSADDGRGWACLMIGMRFRSQVLYMERCRPPKVGDVIQFTPDLVHMKDHIGCAWALSQVGGGSAAAVQVFYTQLGLACYEVTGLRDMAQAEAEFARERAEARKATKLKHLFESLDPKRRPGRKRARDVPATGSDDDCEPLDALDAELARQGLFADGDPEELLAEVPGEDLDEMAAAQQPNADGGSDASEPSNSNKVCSLIAVVILRSGSSIIINNI